jgi:hypothetical protein
MFQKHLFSLPNVRKETFLLSWDGCKQPQSATACLVQIFASFWLMIEIYTKSKTLYLKKHNTVDKRWSSTGTGHEGPEGEYRYNYYFFNLGARWEWVVNGTPRRLYPRDWSSIRCIRGWVDPRAGLKWCGKSRPHRNSIPGPSSP